MSHIIEHNYTVGDFIQFMYSNKVAEGKVESVQISVNKQNAMSLTNKEIKINYYIAFKHPMLQTNEKITLSEIDVFATKEEPLTSLWNIYKWEVTSRITMYSKFQPTKQFYM